MGGLSRFYVKNFLSHSADKFRRKVLYCCKNFAYRKSLVKRGGGEYQVSTSRNFCLTVPKIFRGRIPHCCNNFGYRKSLDKRGGEYQGFPSKFFCFIVAKNFVGELLCAVFQSFSGSEKDFE